jgi:hypothetical protein
VDDIADAPGNEIRARLWSDLANNIFWGSCGDPAEYFATDRRAVIVHPSGVEVVAPDSNAELTVATSHDTPEVQAAWVDVVRSVVDAGVVAQGTAPYAFLARLSDTVSLLAGSRLPVTDAEQRVLESLRGTSDLRIVAVTAHEDESSGAPESFALQLDALQGNFSSTSYEALVFPSADGKCYGAEATTDRYTRWLAASSALSQFAQFWTPGVNCPFDHLSVTCSRSCLDEQPRFSPQGVADCHIYVASDPKEGCPESRGLMPSNASVPDANGPVCEMRQLEGAALESCRHDLSCADCAPGYCFSEVATLVGGCEAQGKVAVPRFVNGAANVPSRKVYVYCEE